MKNLVKYIEEKLFHNDINEKLIINKDYKNPNKTLSDNEVLKIINDYINTIPKLSNYESIFPNSMKTSLNCSLGDYNLNSSFDSVTENEFDKFTGKMKGFGKLMRFPYGSKIKHLDYPIITKKINKMFEKFEEGNFKLETMWEDRKTNFIINYYECKKFMLINIGTPEESTLYFTKK